jgi:hypothetical protein
MNSTQADSYNQCMSTHWSSLADSVLFGVPGYMYHQNAVLSCQQVALATQAPTSFDQPIKPASALAVAPATAAPAAATANPGMPVGAGSPGNEWQPARQPPGTGSPSNGVTVRARVRVSGSGEHYAPSRPELCYLSVGAADGEPLTTRNTRPGWKCLALYE